MKKALLLVLLALAASAAAQEVRATLLGVVTDPSGAAVPDAKVSAVNLDTRVVTATQTNGLGEYLIPFLLPGRYELRVEREGFRTFERSPIALRVQDRTRIDASLMVGPVGERISVVAETPLIEVADASRGQVIENRSITDLPLKSRNPMILMNLAAGAQFTGSLTFLRPFDNGSLAKFSINGGRARVNEFQIDGVPNNSQTPDANVAYVPTVEAVQEVKIQTNTYDAQYGRTGGGIMTMSIRSGTNAWHGTAYEYLKRTQLDANLFANNAAGLPRSKELVDQFGFRFDGPVMLPSYRGRDRTFFMASYERYRDTSPQPVLGTVATELERNGDFTRTLTSAGRQYTIYDPLTTRPNPSFDPSKSVTLNNLQYIRTPVAGNRIPADRFEKIAVNVLKHIPLPNQPGDPVTHANNWYGPNAAENDGFPNFITRIDHTFNPAWRTYGRFNYSDRIINRDSPNDWYTAASPNGHSTVKNYGAVMDTVGILNRSTILNLRLGFGRYSQYGPYVVFDQTQLGVSKNLTSQLQTPNRFPYFTFEGYMSTDRGGSTYKEPTNTYSAQAGVVKTFSRHNVKTGFEYRLIRYGLVGLRDTSGAYNFTRSWTSSNSQVNDASAGNAIASFLLGYMNTATAPINASSAYSWHYPVLYLQDDWQATRRLTFNLGLRWDYERPPVERFNRQNRGFDLTVRSPIQVPGLDLRGGLLFAGVNGQPRGPFNPDRNNWQPRLGMAYRVLKSKPLVFRGGFGLYYLPTTENGNNLGFAVSTSADVSTPDYKPLAVLSNPFPAGIMQPAGASLGLATNVGDAVSFGDPLRVIPKIWQYSAGFQYELFNGLLVEGSYVGSQTSELQTSRSLSYLTPQQLALGTSYLSGVVPNPFYGVLSPKTSRGGQPTIQRRNLIAQYPQFTGVTRSYESLGYAWYNGLQLRVQRRFKQGVSFLVTYTVSKAMEAVSRLNPSDERLSRELMEFDTPRRLVFSGIYEFPVGPGKRWLKSGLAARLLGGWQFNWTGIAQCGNPIGQPDYYIMGNPKLTQGQSMSRWFNTSKEIWVQKPADTLRVVSNRSPNIRAHSAPQVDVALIKDFLIRENHQVQFKAQAFNATNTPIFGPPNTNPTSPLFGVVPINQYNLSRSIELGIRYAF